MRGTTVVILLTASFYQTSSVCSHLTFFYFERHGSDATSVSCIAFFDFQQASGWDRRLREPLLLRGASSFSPGRLRGDPPPWLLSDLLPLRFHFRRCDAHVCLQGAPSRERRTVCVEPEVKVQPGRRSPPWRGEAAGLCSGRAEWTRRGSPSGPPSRPSGQSRHAAAGPTLG